MPLVVAVVLVWVAVSLALAAVWALAHWSRTAVDRDDRDRRAVPSVASGAAAVEPGDGGRASTPATAGHVAAAVPAPRSVEREAAGVESG